MNLTVLWDKTVCGNVLTFHSNLHLPLSLYEYIHNPPKILLVFLHSFSQSPLHQRPSLIIYSPTLSMTPHLFPEYCLHTLLPPPLCPTRAMFQSFPPAALSVTLMMEAADFAETNGIYQTTWPHVPDYIC